MIVHEPANAAAITAGLVANPDIRKINFTGSTAVGKIMGRLAGENLKPILLELGGKASAIVWEDADLDLAADQCALGAFLNSGQICMSTERILVHKGIREAF
jgi:acyl-CoA reductase-like NAD-dependent aldehyde dehydrogenase